MRFRRHPEAAPMLVCYSLDARSLNVTPPSGSNRGAIAAATLAAAGDIPTIKYRFLDLESDGSSILILHSRQDRVICNAAILGGSLPKGWRRYVR